MRGRPVGNQRVVLGEDGVLEASELSNDAPGGRPVRIPARVEDAGPELTEEDNVATAATKVVRQQIRVLLIAGEPSPEVQFLRNALLRDQHVEFAGWIQHADPGFRQPGDRPIQRLPTNDSELRQYDALLMIDPDLRALRPRWPEMITHFVGQEGGGLIFVAGELHSPQLFEAAGPSASGGDWTRILPVVRDPGLYRSEAEVRLSSQSTYALELTPEGRGDPVFEFHPDPLRNRAILTSLPGMYWSFPVTRAAPARPCWPGTAIRGCRTSTAGTCSWPRSSTGQGGRCSSALTAPTAGAICSEDYFDGFWARLVDRVGRNKALGGRFPFQVHLGKGAYRVGDKVSVGVRYTDPAALAEASELTAELEIAGGPPEPLRFERVPDDPGLLTATFPAQQAGTYTLRIVPVAAADLGSGVQSLDHDVSRRSAQAGNRRAFPQPAPLDRARPAHRRPRLRSGRSPAASTTRSRCGKSRERSRIAMNCGMRRSFT